MYAVVKTGGKQFRVTPDDTIKVEKLPGEAGEIITLDDVLMVGGDSPLIGTPKVEGASVAAEILEQARDKKIVVFKKRRRQNYRRKKGHRQSMTVLKVREILTGGAKPTVTASAAAPKANAKPAETPAEAAPAEAKADVKDDVSLIGGVGPKLTEKLAGIGIESLKPLAEMSDQTKAALDEAGILARAEREEWQEQAQELLDGKPPRAKVDQAAAAKKDED